MLMRKNSAASGIRIDNTLSMAVQSRRNILRIPILILIALTGVASTMLTFQSMFQLPLRPMLTLLGVLVWFVITSCIILLPARFTKLRYILLLFVGLSAIPACKWLGRGMSYLVNHVYQVIFQTDQDYYNLSHALPEETCVTVAVLILSFPLCQAICWGVMEHQSFLLPFLASFLPIEFGFFFGIAPDHRWASLAFGFWCALGVLSLSGSHPSKSKSSFQRRRNTFQPVSGMRFMVSERSALLLMCLVTAVCLLSEQLLLAVGYSRADTMKDIRAKVQQFAASLALFDENPLFPFMEDYYDAITVPVNPTDDVVDLEEQDDRQFENAEVSAAIFDQLPKSDVYLKYYTGHVYDDNEWSTLDASVYDAEIFTRFEENDLYPPEFLYYGLQDFQTAVTMQLRNPSGVLKGCVPYGFMESWQLKFRDDNNPYTFATSYTIYGGYSYETILSNPAYLWEYSLYEIYRNSTIDGSAARPYHDNVSVAMAEQGDMEFLPFFSPHNVTPSAEAVEASSACREGYTDFVKEHYLGVPDTPGMYNVYNSFYPLMVSYDYENATPAETIAFLQALREQLCTSVQYTLSPGKTPAGEDFTAYFLLENKKGYCVHYATAGTLLARMAGIPARYCEGYLVHCDEENSDISTLYDAGEYSWYVPILDSSAHAWAEIYIEGLGWIPFEFTHSYYEPVEIPEPVTSEPVTEDTTLQTEPPTESGTLTIPAETSPVTDPAAPGGTETPAGSARISLRPVLTALGIVAVLLVLALCPLLLRRHTLMKRRRTFTQSDKTRAAAAIYAHILRLLRLCGVRDTDGSVGGFGQKADAACGTYMQSCLLSEAVAIAAKARYSPHTPDDAELRCLRHTAAELAGGMYAQSGFFRKLYLKYILRLV